MDSLQARRSYEKGIDLCGRQTKRRGHHLRYRAPALNVRCAIPFDADLRAHIRRERLDDGIHIVEQSGIKERKPRLAGGDALRNDHLGRWLGRGVRRQVRAQLGTQGDCLFFERMSEDEALNVFGWNKRPVIITLDTGVQLVPMADDEGNDGGAICTTDEQYPLLGTL